MITDYKEYLNSYQWKETREKTFKLKGRKCQRCSNNIHLHIHHATYARIEKENIQTDLYVLCNSCHEQYHKLTKVISIQTTKAFISDFKTKSNKFKQINEKRLKKLKKKKHYIKDLKQVIKTQKDERLQNLHRLFRKGRIDKKEYEEKLKSYPHSTLKT